MRPYRLIVLASALAIALLVQPAAAETYQSQDNAGSIEFDFPGISDEPFDPTEQWVDPLITKQFGFEAPGASAVLVSTLVTPGPGAQDSLIDGVQARQEPLMQALGEEHFIARRFQAGDDDIFEVIILNEQQEGDVPFGLPEDESTDGLETVGINQALAREGRLIELAVHLTKQDGEDREALIARARNICDTWRASLKILPAEPWEPKLADPPEGYSWWLCPLTKTVLLKPAGWHTKVDLQQGTFGYFISKENIDEQGAFLTGLTVNVVPAADRRFGMPTPQALPALMAQIMKDRQVVSEPQGNDQGPFAMYNVTLIDEDKEDGAFVTFNLLMANKKTGTLYIVIFEAPASEWEQAWQIGTPILQQLTFSPNI